MVDPSNAGLRKARVFINSFPKAGTHLLRRLLLLLGFGKPRRAFVGPRKSRMSLTFWLSHAWVGTDSVMVGLDMPATIRSSYVRSLFEKLPPGNFICGHAIYSDHLASLAQVSKLKSIIVLRDPRDIVVSHAHYVYKTPGHPLHKHYVEQLEGFRERLTFSITGGMAGNTYLESIGSRVRGMNGWLRHSDTDTDTLVVKFEDVIGPSGRGDAQQQLDCIEGICRFLGEDVASETVQKVASNLFGGTDTFRKGMIGAWKEAFDNKLEDLFYRSMGSVLVSWGYEK